MQRLSLLVKLALLATVFQAGSPFTLLAENVTGTILIRKRLTKRSVAGAASVYDRGPGVPLRPVNEGKDEREDPLDFERTRVVIWLEGTGKDRHLGGSDASVPAAAVSATMQQLGRTFAPDLLVIPVGSAVTFPNMDLIFHNVFSLSKPKTFDLGNYVKGESRSVTFPKAGIVYVNCHLHPNMSAAIVVTPNQWYATAGRDGQYTLRDIPPGVYTAVAWHKAAGFFRKTVEVQAQRGANVDFFIPIGEGETLKSPRLSGAKTGVPGGQGLLVER